MQGNNVNHLLEVVKTYLPYGPQYYSENQVTDHPERFIISELIREKVLHMTKEEVPHSVAVTIESIEKIKDKTLYMQASIITKRDYRKRIHISKKEIKHL